MGNILLSLLLLLSTCYSSYSQHVTGRSCLELKQKNVTRSGVYSITPCQSDPSKTVKVYCDMETDEGGWTIIQRRDNYNEQENFTRSWEDYANGFGSLEKDFWLGNDAIHCLTSQHPTTLRFDLEDFEGNTRWAKYSNFSVDDRENLYQLTVIRYTGNAGNSFGYHNTMKFSTIDKDNDISGTNCADLYKGGWWYVKCHYSNLNGLYLKGAHSSYADGVNWRHWKGYNYSLKKSEMKIRGSGILPPWRIKARSCLELKQNNVKRSGVYSIKPCQSDPEKIVKVYCDMKTDEGGWTVIQRRDNYTEQENFYRSWEDYTNGFGSLKKDFWLGNDAIHCLTSQHSTTVRFDLEDFEDNTRWAKYSNFLIDDRENLYKLQVSGYTGNAGDSFSIKQHIGMKFTTIDSDNDICGYGVNCAKKLKGGWWYGCCHSVNINGLYLNGNHSSYADGINWETWKGFHYSLKKTEMKIRGNAILPPWSSRANCTTSGQSYQHGETWSYHCRDLTCTDGHIQSILISTCCQSGKFDYSSGSTWLHRCQRYRCDNGEAHVVGKDPDCGDCYDKRCSDVGGFCTTSEKWGELCVLNSQVLLKID